MEAAGSGPEPSAAATTPEGGAPLRTSASVTWATVDGGYFERRPANLGTDHPRRPSLGPPAAGDRERGMPRQPSMAKSAFEVGTSRRPSMGAWSSKEKDRDLAVTMRRPSVVMILSRSGPALSYSNTAITLGREKTRGELSFDQQSDGPAYGSPFVKAALSTLAGRIPVYAVVAALVLGFTCIGIGGAIRQHHLDEVSRAVLERPQYTSLVTTASLSSLPALTSPSSVSVSSSLAASATATPGPSLFARRRDGIGAIYKSGVRAGATSTRTSTSVQPSGTVYVDAAHRASHNGAVLVGMTERQKELASLALNIGVTILTEANGYVHGATLRTNLAKIDRLAFNANLRLFRSGGSFWSANGLVSNILFSVSLVLAYASTNLVFCYLGRNLFITSGLPLLVLGGCIIVQAVIALWGYFVTSDIIWSTSALETTAACQVLGHVAARPGRCLAPVAHWDHHDPFWLDGAKPAEPQQRQPSAWQSHATVRRVVLFMWFTVGMGFAWAFTSLGYLIVREKRIAEQWSPLVDDESPYIGIYLPVGDNFSGLDLAFDILIICFAQCMLTLGLHMAELVVTLSRDESLWRMASRPEGALAGMGPIRRALTSWQSLPLLASKSLLHFLCNNAISLAKTEDTFTVGNLVMRPVQVFYLALFFALVAGFVTYLARRRPYGPQPAAYGHIQTLADLIDEWPQWEKRLHWGFKQGYEVIPGYPHAGLSPASTSS